MLINKLTFFLILSSFYNSGLTADLCNFSNTLDNYLAGVISLLGKLQEMVIFSGIILAPRNILVLSAKRFLQ